MSEEIERPFMLHLVTGRGLWRVYVTVRGETFDFGTLPEQTIHAEEGL